MHCPTCGDYGDLVIVRVKKTGEQVIVCAECDLLWTDSDINTLAADRATNVESFLKQRGLPSSWDALEVIKRR
jgi:uncharacterized protein YjfI (DUF2170 family)